MASPKELDPAVKDRIGDFYLRQLIKYFDIDNLHYFPRREMNYVVFSLKEMANIELPKSLIDQLDLTRLWWQQLGDSRCLPRVFLGYSGKPSLPALNNAIATVEIARRVDFSREGAEDYQPSFVRIGGIINGRVVGLKYKSSTNRLLELNVSLSNQEVDRFNNPFIPREEKKAKENLFVTLPSSIDAPYNSAALLTKGMCEKANPWSTSAHEQALTLLLESNNFVIVGRATSIPDWRYRKNLITKLGYYAKDEDGNLKVGFTTSTGIKRTLPSWEIQVPLQLQPA